MDEELQRSAKEARQELENMTAKESLAVARFVRNAKTRLRTDRQRELAEETARRFEERAAAQVRPSPPA